MDLPTAEKRLKRAQEKIQALEKLIEDKSRELYLSNEKLQLTNDYLEDVVTAMLNSLIVTDAAGAIQTANQAALTLLEYEESELLGKQLHEIFVADDHFDPRDTTPLIQPDTLTREEVKYRTKTGEEIPVLFSSSAMHDDNGQVKGIVCIAMDLSGRKHLEMQLLQSQKMASVGQLAAGIAHEINNPMGFIHSNLGTLSEYVEDLTDLIEAYAKLEEAVTTGNIEKAQAQNGELSKKKEELDLEFLFGDIENLVSESCDGADRVRKIVQNLKEFSHIDKEEKTTADLNKGLESTLNIAWSEIKYKAKVEKEYGDIPEVLCYPSELNQIFLNILVNAAQAIEEQGTITIRTYAEEEYVCIDIADDGAGMPPQVQQRIFDPFYTTKEVGKGTGLGLSMGYSIVVDKHGGQLLVESQEGEGTTFTIKIPLAAQ
jgi:two-component system NtrC family sensor kinase